MANSFNVAENSQLDAQFTIVTPGSLEYLELNGVQFTESQLISATPSSPLSINSEIYGEFVITGFTPSSGILTFNYDPSGNNQDHTGAVDDVLRETITIRVKDFALPSVTDANLIIDVTDSNPSAVDDSRSISEGNSAITGNAIGAAGSVVGDNQDTLIDPNASPVTAVSSNGSNGPLGSPFSGNFGSLILDSQGTYTYSLDNTNPSIQGLKPGESVTDAFIYTITDGDGDTDSATLTIAIDGVDDVLPVVTINDSNGADAGDISVAEDQNLATSSLLLQASAGFAVSGAALNVSNENSNAASITLDELQNLSVAPINVVGLDGQLTLTGFNDTSGVLTYTYDPSGNGRDHSGGEQSVVKQFQFQISDTEGDQNPAETLDILITDTNPVANNDATSVGENDGSLVGNAVFASGAAPGDAADVLNDTNITPVTSIDFGATNGNVGASLSGTYGALLMNSTGVYTYTIDENNSMVQALKTGGSLTDTFSYAIEDGDGDSDLADLSITINGVDDTAPQITISDANGSATGNASVIENQSDNFNNITLLAEAGIADTVALEVTYNAATSQLSLAQLNDLASSNLVINATDGTLTLTNFNASTGVLSYTFASRSGLFDHSSNNEFSEDFDLRLFDAEGDNGTATLSVLIEDSAPIALNDARNILEGTSAIAGNAVGTSGSATGDVADTVNTATSVTDVDFGTVDGTVGMNLSGSYGSLGISSNGVYTYTLDNTNAEVQGLKATETLIETFTYTITDDDASTDTADLQVTIDGVEDALPTLSFNGSSSANVISVPENVGFAGFSQISITASAGLQNTGPVLTITPQGGSAVDLTLSQLLSLSSTPIPISGSVGTMTLTAYNSRTGVLNYAFTVPGVPGSFNHVNSNSVQDFFTFQVTDNEGDSATETIEFELTDTAPTAAPDTAEVTEDVAPNIVTGDVLTNDTQGADTSSSVSAISFSSSPQTVGIPFTSAYGSLDLNSDGTYTYTLDNANPTVDALDDNDSLVETFNYTIEDTDGDTSSTILSVEIRGVTD